MGFYIRKSVSVGPLRFNLSKSGLGVSSGFPGFRVGSGPRGNYVHMGRGGLYYRAPLGGGSFAHPRYPAPSHSTANEIEMVEIESASAEKMTDASSATVLEEINAKLKAWSVWPFVLICALVGVWLLVGQSPGLSICIAAVGAAATWLVYQHDAMRTSVVMMYDFEEPAAARFQAFHDAFDDLSRCGRVGHIAAKGDVRDRKRNAGAGALVNRHVIRPHKSSPFRIRTNIEVPALPVGRQTLHFFPDRVLVIDAAGAGAVAYTDLRLEVRQSRFIESDGVPADAKVVGKTWQ